MTCLFSSFVSALFYMSMTMEAVYVQEQSRLYGADTLSTLQLWGGFCETPSSMQMVATKKVKQALRLVELQWQVSSSGAVESHRWWHSACHNCC
jgi:hypothetical protein